MSDEVVSIRAASAVAIRREVLPAASKNVSDGPDQLFERRTLVLQRSGGAGRGLATFTPITLYKSKNCWAQTLKQ